MLWNAFILALRELRRNKMRSFLTMLGIIIGVAAVITLVTLGEGATKQVTDQIADLGSNMLMIRPGKQMGPRRPDGASQFDISDAEALQREIPSLVAVAPSVDNTMTAIYANENWSTKVTGTSEQYFTIRNREIQDGRLFTDVEANAGAAVCVIGETVREKLFGTENPIGQRIRLTKLSCEVVGLLKPKGESSMGQDQDDIVIIPLKTYQRRIAGNTDVSSIQVSVRDGASKTKAESDISALLRIRRHLSDSEEDDFDVMDMEEIASMLTSTTKILTSLLGAVAAVSLLVGGIGIMNIMLVSVTERTREIGTRLAIGALEWEVLLQFLVEAVVMSSCGGIIGIIIALSTSMVAADILGIPFVLNYMIILISFLFSAAVGIVFGYFPARKAAMLDPIEALHHE